MTAYTLRRRRRRLAEVSATVAFDPPPPHPAAAWRRQGQAPPLYSRFPRPFLVHFETRDLHALEPSLSFRPLSFSSNKLDVKVTKILAPLRVAQIRGGYTVLINTWKRDSLLKQSVGHHASCSGTDAIHVVWSESDPPSDKLKAYLKKIVLKKSQTAQKPNFRFDLNKEDNLNNRFKPIEDLRTDAIFSVDDDIIVPCPALDFAFTVWQSAPSTMVGFVPRMHWLNKERNSVLQYRYGGWWSVWWMGTYSMVLSKAAFLHRKYLDLYTYKMSSSVHDYVTKERNCEDVAMSLLVANASGAPPIWVKGKIYEIGSSSISSLQGHSKRRTKCLNDFFSLYGHMPLVSTNVKALDAWRE